MSNWTQKRAVLDRHIRVLRSWGMMGLGTEAQLSVGWVSRFCVQRFWTLAPSRSSLKLTFHLAQMNSDMNPLGGWRQRDTLRRNRVQAIVSSGISVPKLQVWPREPASLKWKENFLSFLFLNFRAPCGTQTGPAPTGQVLLLFPFFYLLPYANVLPLFPVRAGGLFQPQPAFRPAHSWSHWQGESVGLPFPGPVWWCWWFKTFLVTCFVTPEPTEAVHHWQEACRISRVPALLLRLRGPGQPVRVAGPNIAEHLGRRPDFSEQPGAQFRQARTNLSAEPWGERHRAVNYTARQSF